jgi:parallel beta-helix repeat protein
MPVAEEAPMHTARSRRVRVLRAGVAAGTLTAITLTALPAHAVVASSTTYVSPTGSETNGDTSCTDAAFTSIQAAVDATASGGTVIVCKGTYAESVTVTSQLTLEGAAGAVINAKGQPYGVGLAHSHDTVTGLTVENATVNAKEQTPGDGIITAGFVGSTPVASNDDIIIGNVTRDNEGTGIDLNSTTGSIADNNVAEGNGAGINLSNDLGKPSSHNLVSGNVASHNPGGCGIVLADHSGVGVFGNVITGNTVVGNGLGTPSRPSASSGSGVIIGVGAKTGGVYNNVISGNVLTGNGHAGVAVHGHLKGVKLTGNKILDNRIGRNNLRTDYKDLKTTGVYLGGAGSFSITIAGNLFVNDKVGVFSAGPVVEKSKSTNTFRAVTKHYVHIAKYAG